MEKYSNYLREGIQLANTNSSVTLFLIGIAVLNVLLVSIGVWDNPFTSIFSLLITLYLLAAEFTLYQAFEKSKKEQITLKDFVLSTFTLLKRLFLPLVAVVFVFGILVIVVLTILIASRVITPAILQFSLERSAVELLWYGIFSLVSVIPASLGIFIPIFYVLKREGLVKSIKKSVQTAIHYRSFFLFILLSLWVITIFSFPLIHKSVVLSIIVVAIQQYCHICVYGTVYLFSKKHVIDE